MKLKSNNFYRIADHMGTWLTYSQIIGKKASKEEIINDIQSINLIDALTIISKFSVLDENSKKILMDELSLSIKDKDMIEKVEPFDLINLLYSAKWFLAYGKKKQNSTFENKYPNYFNILLTILKISDYLVENIDSEDEIENQLFKTWLFSRSGVFDKVLIRQHVMFQEIARNQDFKNRLKNKFIDIHSIFENEYGYSIQEYIATLITLHQQSINELNLLDAITDIEWGINSKNFFDNVKIKNTAESISQDISTDIASLKKWAKETLDNPFDYEVLLSTPLFKSGDWLIPFSPALLNSTVFDGLCFKLIKCCNNVKKDFFSFFGYLFEEYVSKTLSSAVESSKKVTSYEFKAEFKYGKENKDSSDAYLLLGKTLLIFECKSGRLKKETKIYADSKFSKEDHLKYVINPIIQANKAYINILNERPEIFKNIKKVIILSVSLQTFPKVPKYDESLEKLKDQLHPDIKDIEYIGLIDLELLAYFIYNHEIPLYKFISNKKVLDEFIPYPNYYYKKYGEIKRTDYQNAKLKECFDNTRKTLF